MDNNNNNNNLPNAKKVVVQDQAEHAATQLPSLPSSRLTVAQVDRLLHSLRGEEDSPHNNNNNNDTGHGFPSLKGRPVLIPFGRCAFFEGQLDPSTIRVNIDNNNSFVTKPTIKTKQEVQDSLSNCTALHTATEKVDDKYEKEEEEVFISVSSQSADASSKSELVSIPLSQAITWLEKSSSTSMKDHNILVSKQQKTNVVNHQQSRTGDRQTNASNAHYDDNDNRHHSIDTTSNTFPMVEIQEEYTADGTQVYGKAIDVTAKLRSLWKQEQQQRVEETRLRKEEEKMDFSDYPDDVDENDTFAPLQNPRTAAVSMPTDTFADSSDHLDPPKLEIVSDEDYDRLTRRLEELALLEEQQQQQEQKVQQTQNHFELKKTKVSPKSLTFQKGFLNQPRKVKQKASNQETNVESKSTITISKQGNDSATVIKKSKITIDLEKNTIREIPREGRQQPLPIKSHDIPLHHPQQTPSQQPRPTRIMIDQAVFNGQIQERPMSNNTSSNASTIQYSHQSSTSRESDNNVAKPKRRSRFTQERQQQF